MDSSKEEIVLKALDNLALEERPFNSIAAKTGLTEEEVIRIVNSLLEKGVLRRIGIAIEHRSVGLTANAMVLWAVPEEDVQKKGRELSSFPEITHCYHRQVPESWNYNIFTVVHATSRELCLEKIRNIARKTGLADYQVLFSTEEFKKTSITYNL